jgi:hypothetical protein
LGDQGDAGRYALWLLCAAGTLAHSAIPMKLLQGLFSFLKDQWPAKENDVDFETCVILLEGLGIIKTFKHSSQLTLHAVFYKVAFPLGLQTLKTSFDMSNIEMPEDLLKKLCWRALAEFTGNDVIWGQAYVPPKLNQTSRLIAPHLLHLLNTAELQGKNDARLKRMAILT